MNPATPSRRVKRAGRGARVRGILGGVLAGSFLLAFLAFWFSLPDPLFPMTYSAVLTGRDGQLLSARVAADGQWRFPPGQTVPPRFAEALIAFEDRRFRSHFGVDPLAVARAFRDNFQAGRIVSGASTLTMQVIRMARGNRRRTYGEKALEAVLALRLELTRGKDEILALYSAHAPFGGNVVGVRAAAWRYFGRPPEDLSWAEQATLAVLPNAPGLVHPARSRQALRERRDRLLRHLSQSGHLDSVELRLSMREPLPGAPRPLPQQGSVLLDRLVSNGKPEIFRTTLDGALQTRVEQIMAFHAPRMRAAGIYNAAVVVIDNKDFTTVAYAGNLGRPGMKGHGYAIDLAQARRSTGSLLKPFLFAAMLEHGELQPGSLVPDIPIQFDGLRPENYDKRHRGAVPASVALARSLNIPATVLLRRHGVGRFQALLEKLGMRTLFRTPGEYGLTLILGGAEGTLSELTAIYANLARIALYEKPREGIQLLRPTLLQGRKPEEIGPAPFGAGSAWLTLKTLVEVNRPGSNKFWRNFSNAQPVAWKTGTSYGLRDGWAIGTTPRYTVGVWTGNATGEGRTGLTGLGVAAPILFSVFGLVDGGGWFEKPEALLRTIEVCRSDGYLPSNGCPRIKAEVPIRAHFNGVSRNQRWLHLDPSGRWRVHAGCESVASMVSTSWFILPPLQEHYFRRHNAEYRPLPPWRSDCRPKDGVSGPAFQIVYPNPGTGVYIPTDFGGVRSGIVLKAAHRDPEALLYWHMDGRMIATTRVFHEVAIDLEPGAHRLTVVDQQGERHTRDFQVFGPETNASIASRSTATHPAPGNPAAGNSAD